jgi:hypothetical protein
VIRKSISLMLIVTFAWLLGIHVVRAQKDDAKEQAELARALKGVKVSLEEALLASEREGKPISAEFEVEEGKLELSVFIIKGNKFFEVTVNHKTGKIDEVEPITDRKDLADAKTQNQAMTKARLSLRAATEKTVKANEGFRAVSVIPTLKDGHPAAEVTLVKGEEFKTVSVNLD